MKNISFFGSERYTYLRKTIGNISVLYIVENSMNNIADHNVDRFAVYIYTYNKISNL